jgi:hypothetical protein
MAGSLLARFMGPCFQCCKLLGLMRLDNFCEEPHCRRFTSIRGRVPRACKARADSVTARNSLQHYFWQNLPKVEKVLGADFRGMP